MGSMIQIKSPIRQIAYFVPDIENAALAHSQQFGSGPFFIAKNIALSRSEHRGVPRPLDHSSAYGQWGDIMIEFVQQNNPGPSVFHDMFPEGSGLYGVHHSAIFVDDINEAIAQYEQNGFETALYAEVDGGTAFAMINMVTSLGHMLELYEPSALLVGFYDMVSQAATDFDGSDPIRFL